MQHELDIKKTRLELNLPIRMGAYLDTAYNFNQRQLCNTNKILTKDSKKIVTTWEDFLTPLVKTRIVVESRLFVDYWGLLEDTFSNTTAIYALMLSESIGVKHTEISPVEWDSETFDTPKGLFSISFCPKENCEKQFINNSLCYIIDWN